MKEFKIQNYWLYHCFFDTCRNQLLGNRTIVAFFSAYWMVGSLSVGYYHSLFCGSLIRYEIDNRYLGFVSLLSTTFG